MFTGSTATDREVAVNAGEHLTKVSMELGGKSPNIVFSDANFKHYQRRHEFVNVYVSTGKQSEIVSKSTNKIGKFNG